MPGTHPSRNSSRNRTGVPKRGYSAAVKSRLGALRRRAKRLDHSSIADGTAALRRETRVPPPEQLLRGCGSDRNRGFH